MAVVDANGARVPAQDLAERVSVTQRSALLAVAGREGAVVGGLSALESGQLASWGVLGPNDGLTCRGVALRRILADRLIDDAFGAR